MQLQIPTKTIVKLFFTAVLVFVLIQLMPLVMMLIMAAMLAVSLHPVFRWLESKRLHRSVGVSALVFLMLAVAGLIVFFVVPTLFEQTSTLATKLSELSDNFVRHLPEKSFLRTFVVNSLKVNAMPTPSTIITPLFSAGQRAFGGLADLVLIFIFTIYLLVHGARAIQWALAFFPEVRRVKLRATADEVSDIIGSYVAGQVITSVICGVYTCVALALLKVPEALTLGVLAALFDVLPVLGFFLAAIPAVLIAFTVSPFTAALVFVLYVAYHALENYLLLPKIYGGRLRLTDLVVLLSLVAAGILGGVSGAIVILPLVASYPVIERIWLVNLLGREVVREHMISAAESEMSEQKKS